MLTASYVEEGLQKNTKELVLMAEAGLVTAATTSATEPGKASL
jgi:hypothetical protein